MAWLSCPFSLDRPAGASGDFFKSSKAGETPHSFLLHAQKHVSPSLFLLVPHDHYFFPVVPGWGKLQSCSCTLQMGCIGGGLSWDSNSNSSSSDGWRIPPPHAYSWRTRQGGGAHHSTHHHCHCSCPSWAQLHAALLEWAGAALKLAPSLGQQGKLQWWREKGRGGNMTDHRGDVGGTALEMLKSPQRLLQGGLPAPVGTVGDWEQRCSHPCSGGCCSCTPFTKSWICPGNYF